MLPAPLGSPVPTGALPEGIPVPSMLTGEIPVAVNRGLVWFPVGYFPVPALYPFISFDPAGHNKHGRKLLTGLDQLPRRSSRTQHPSRKQ